MTWPVPSKYPITTPYGKRGTSWSCNEDSSGKGVHTGVDMACPSGTALYATIDGQIRHRSYGSAFGSHQFAISPDPGQPFEDGEVFYAHARKRLADGVYVRAGDWVGEAGAEGNVTGPHLHYEYHPDTKNAWNCGVHADPGPTLGVASSDAPYVTEHVYRSKCGYGEPSNGDDFSDTVKELQERLNRISLVGGQELPITGVYAEQTDEEVRLWQEQICGDTPDPALKSYLGPKQFQAMFPDETYTRHDDGDAAIASGGDSSPPPDTSSGTTLGQWLKAQGFDVDDSSVPLGRESTWREVEFLMVHHTASPDSGSEKDIANYIKNGGSGTYPPLAQIMLGKSGKVWMTCQERSGQEDPGRASHAGSGRGYGIPDDTMNERCLGIEVQNDGTKPLSSNTHQYNVLIALLDSLADRYGVPKENVIGHKEWSTTGKVDPLDDMDKIRQDVWNMSHPPIEPDPPEEIEEPDEERVISTFGLYKWYSGKETNEVRIYPDGEWHNICKEMAPSNVTDESSEIHFLYLRIKLPAGRSASRNIETRWVRSNGDETAYKGPEFTAESKDSIPYENMHIEDGSGLGGQWQIQVTGGTDPIVVTTRYAKTHIYSQDEVTVLVSQALQASGSAFKSVIELLKGLS